MQDQHPAEFLGEWTENSAHDHGRTLALFVKAAPADRWRTTLFISQASASADPVPDPAIDKGGYARRPSAAEFDRLDTSPAQLANDVSSLWNRYRDPFASLPPDLAPGPVDDGTK